MACMDQLGFVRERPCRHAARIHGPLAKAAIRVVLEAMREPEQKGFKKALREADEFVLYSDGRGLWQRLIDAFASEQGIELGDSHD